MVDPAIVGALSAVLGSVVGGAASISTAWFTQRAQSRRDSVASEMRRRETVYTEFIAECSKLAIDALDNTLDKPATLIQVYALLNRIRLASSAAVVIAADKTIGAIIDQYFRQSVTLEQMRGRAAVDRMDPLREFSAACRDELEGLRQRG